MRNLPITASQVAAVVGGSVEGDGQVSLSSVAPMDSATAGQLTFATDERRAARLGASNASAAIVAAHPSSAPMTLIRVANVQKALATLLGHIADAEDLPAGRHASAVVDPSAVLAGDVRMGPNVTVGPRAKIGSGCVLCANASVGADVVIGDDTILFDGAVIRSGSRLGSRVRIGPNSVIGWDGFGFYFAGGVHNRIPHAGSVVIEDDVEIGACACVDKAKFGTTFIGAGTKIDNLVQVAHNVQMGRGCVVAGLCGVAGSAKLGNYVIVGGHAGIRDNVTIGDGVQCAAFTGVMHDLTGGQTVAGMPAGPATHQYRIMLGMQKLPELIKKVRELESRLAALEPPKND